MAEQPRLAFFADRVYSHVKMSLLDGVYRPGTAIVVEKLAADLQVSRQPVMDALKRLSTEGFVTIVPQVGCRVRGYTADEVQDFFQFLAAGESVVAGLAAQRARAEDVVPMKIISAQIGAIARTRKSAAEKAGAYRALNRELHAVIARTARSPSIAELVTTLGDRSDFLIASAERPVYFERLQRAHREHEQVIGAIEAGDGDKAARVMREHILDTARRLRSPQPAEAARARQVRTAARG